MKLSYEIMTKFNKAKPVIDGI